MLRKGDLIFYDPSGKAHKRVELGVEAELKALALQPEGILVSDSRESQLIFVSRDDFSVTRIGQDSLQDSLRAIAQQRSLWQNTHYAGLEGMIAFICIDLIAGYLDWQARELMERKDQTDRPTPIDGEWTIPDEIKSRVSQDADGIYWLSVKKECLKTLRILLWIMLATLIWIFYITFSSKDFGLNATLLLSIVMISVLFSALTWFLFIALPRLRLGTDGRSLFLVDYLGRKASAKPQSGIRTQNRILIGNLAVPIKKRGPTIFDRALYRILIEPMPALVPKTSEFSLLWRYLRNGDPATWLGLTIIALLLVKDLWF